jgi:hypothetical protein
MGRRGDHARRLIEPDPHSKQFTSVQSRELGVAVPGTDGAGSRRFDLCLSRRTIIDDTVVYYKHNLPSRECKNSNTDKWMQRTDLMLISMSKQRAKRKNT